MAAAELEFGVSAASVEAHHPDAVPQRGRDARALHRQGARLPRAQRRRGRGADRRQRQHRRLAGDRRGAGARVVAGRRASGYGAALHRRHRGRARPLRDHGRRRRQLRLRARSIRSSSELRAGDDLVMGNRFTGGIAPGAMPPLHRYLGNPGADRHRPPVLPQPDRRLPLRPARLPTRADAQPRTCRPPGMEFASEMVVQGDARRPAHRRGADDAVARRPQSRPPHLRTWRDGWRHLRFLLIYQPALAVSVSGARDPAAWA